MNTQPKYKTLVTLANGITHTTIAEYCEQMKIDVSVLRRFARKNPGDARIAQPMGNKTPYVVDITATFTNDELSTRERGDIAAHGTRFIVHLSDNETMRNEQLQKMRDAGIGIVDPRELRAARKLRKQTAVSQ